MKKIIPILVVSLLVLGTTILWLANSEFTMPVAEITQIGVIIMIVGLAVYLAIKRLRSLRRGEPAEDELSKKILRKASSFSYYVSIYLWLAVMFVNDHLTIRTDVLIGTGILGMAVIWVAFVIFFWIRGIKNE